MPLPHAYLFSSPPPPTRRQTHRCKRVHAQMQLAVGSCMPFCRCQKVLLCLSLPPPPSFPSAPRCCCCGCCGHSLKFVAKSVYWFAMCNSHSMKIELFLWLLIGLQQREAGEGGAAQLRGRIQCLHAKRLLDLMLETWHTCCQFWLINRTTLG